MTSDDIRFLSLTIIHEHWLVETFKKVEATSLPPQVELRSLHCCVLSGRPLADSEDRRAIMLFTSGSSGTPKGVARSFQELNFFLSYGVPQVAVHYSFSHSHLSESCVMPSVFMAGGELRFQAMRMRFPPRLTYFPISGTSNPFPVRVHVFNMIHVALPGRS